MSEALRKTNPFNGDDFAEIFVRGVSVAGGEPRGTTEYTGPRGLMLAVLEEGIRTFLYGKGRLQSEAEHWINSRGRALFSFEIVCEVLGLDPNAAKRALKRLQAEAVRPDHSVSRIRRDIHRDRHAGQ